MLHNFIPMCTLSQPQPCVCVYVYQSEFFYVFIHMLILSQPQPCVCVYVYQSEFFHVCCTPLYMCVFYHSLNHVCVCVCVCINIDMSVHSLVYDKHFAICKFAHFMMRVLQSAINASRKLKNQWVVPYVSTD
jgi:hypothetical protein